MTTEGYRLALTYQAAHGLQAQHRPFDTEVQKRLNEHLQMMELIVQQTIAAQDAVSSIYTNTLMIADASMSTKASIKAARQASGAVSGLEEFEHIQTVRLLDMLRQIASQASRSVMAEVV